MYIENKINSVALQFRRTKTDWSGYYQMAVQGALWLSKRYPSTLISLFLTQFRYFSIKQLPNCPHEAGWSGPRSRSCTYMNVSRVQPGSNLVCLGWQSTLWIPSLVKTQAAIFTWYQNRQGRQQTPKIKILDRRNLAWNRQNRKMAKKYSLFLPLATLFLIPPLPSLSLSLSLSLSPLTHWRNTNIIFTVAKGLIFHQPN